MKRNSLTILTPVCLIANRHATCTEYEKRLSLQHLKECLESVSNQTIFKAKEWQINQLLILNGDDIDIIKEFIYLIKNELNQNVIIDEYSDNKLFPSAIRNYGLRNQVILNSDFIMLLDADDFLPKERIKNTVDAFSIGESIVAVSSNFYFVDDQGGLLDFSLDKYTSELLNPNYTRSINGWNTLFLFEKARWFNLCGYCVKTKFLLKHGFKETYTSEDIWLHCQILSGLGNQIYLLEDSQNWGFYRIHKFQFTAGIKLSINTDYISNSISIAREALSYLLKSKYDDSVINLKQKKQLMAYWEINTSVRQFKLFRKDSPDESIKKIAQIIFNSLENAKELLYSSNKNDEYPIVIQMIIQNEFPQLLILLEKESISPLDIYTILTNAKKPVHNTLYK